MRAFFCDGERFTLGRRASAKQFAYQVQSNKFASRASKPWLIACIFCSAICFATCFARSTTFLPTCLNLLIGSQATRSRAQSRNVCDPYAQAFTITLYLFFIVSQSLRFFLLLVVITQSNKEHLRDPSNKLLVLCIRMHGSIVLYFQKGKVGMVQVRPIP